MVLTKQQKKAGIFRLGDETNIHVMFTTSVGVSRKLSKRINLGIEHQVMATDNDYLTVFVSVAKTTLLLMLTSSIIRTFVWPSTWVT